MRHKPVPPGEGVLLVPTGSKRDAAAALGMYPACRWYSSLAQRGAFAGVRVLGPGAIPGRVLEWEPPVSVDCWSTLVEGARSVLGEFTSMAVHLRRPQGRDGVTLFLIRDGAPLGFVKLRRSPARGIDTERQVLELLARNRPRRFRAPEALAHGECDGWSYLVVSSIADGLHRVPGRFDFQGLQDEMSSILSRGLTRPADLPAHWVPIHGDLTPWNLRRTRGGLILLDWEETSWGPAGADLAWYDLAVEGGRLDTATTGLTHPQEVYRFWLDRVGAKPAEDAPTPEVLGLLRRLAH